MRNTNMHTWTKSAVMCYERGGVCRGCYYENFFTKGTYDTQTCKMKKTIIFLVREIGLPPKKKLKGAKDERWLA
jgi:Ni,Fe-hydrogenase I small subunit